ncbi:hypothetical protein C7999DRAFT_10665 [Corynascus novoguineensis]|uniref:Shugoshin n=1 Tax=Corynascus novoguineensis TaxID=1126955 RepID=A0AAN7HUF2_9PEZI|nr:hypothetical protein C7999DRAFT_10665 [Corynascus novoguineensis]
MARLNEAPMPAESHLEILRRKFLRQNRDIAKINSDQSQKIRRLENDCARLLSENLELRGQILRLEKQVEDNSARRIADHALEVKAKLEVQLSEFAALLGSLGVEPPSKRRSSGDRRLSKPRQSMTRSPPQRRRRNTSIDSEALAEMEGRLPPIYENKTYPRATMGSDEIMALCAAAEDVNDSSDLGPPPVSRYVEDFSVMNSPTKPLETYVQESPRRRQTVLSPPQLDQITTSSDSSEIRTDAEQVVVKESSPRKQAPAKESASEPSSQAVRPSVKRKYGDEDGLTQCIAPVAGKENDVSAKSFPTRNGPKRRSLAEMANAKPEKKTMRAPLSAKRTPLAAKSTNEDVSSPRKVAKSAPLKDIKKEKEHQGAPGDSVMQGEGNAPKPPVEIIIPADHNLLETATSLPSATPSSPTTPPRPAQREVLTPPPADISSTGETTRPTRRARAAISYVEPNLRDKMRRPTKELFDAVSGEGKYAHRTAVQAKDGHHSAPTSVSKVKPEPGSSTGGSSKTISVSDRAPLAQQRALLSPLAQKDVLPESLPNTVVTERRKRMSAAGGNRASLAAQEGPDNADREPSPVIVARPEGATQTSSSRHRVSVSKASIDNQQIQSRPSATEVDIYDFTASSPAVVSSKAPAASGGSEPRPTSSHPAPPTQSNSLPSSRQRTARKSSMAAAAALREILDEEEHDAESKPPRPQAPPKSRAAHGGRKRASMLAPKKSSMLMDEGSEDFLTAADADTSGTSTEGDSGIIGNGSGRDTGRISRRRSMML